MEEKLEKLACVLKVGKTCLCLQDYSAEMSLKVQVYTCTDKHKVNLPDKADTWKILAAHAWP